MTTTKTVLWITPLAGAINRYREALIESVKQFDAEIVDAEMNIVYLNDVDPSIDDIVRIARDVNPDYVVVDAVGPRVRVDELNRRLAELNVAVIRPRRERVAINPHGNHYGPAPVRFCGYMHVDAAVSA